MLDDSSFRLAQKLKSLISRISERINFVKNKNFPTKNILFVSLQKSGTYLLHKIMKQAGFEGVGCGKNYSLNNFKGLKDNQYLWSHFPPSDDIQVALERGNSSLHIIFNYRDPRDVLVSWYYWLHPRLGGNMHSHQRIMREVYSNFSDDELIEIFIRNDKFREEEYNPIEQFRFSRVLLYHPKVLKVRFEDLIGLKGGGNTRVQRNSIRRIFEYINCRNIDEDLIARNAFDPNSKTFRKGLIGNYRDELSERHKRLFNDLHGDIIQQYGYEVDRF